MDGDDSWAYFSLAESHNIDVVAQSAQLTTSATVCDDLTPLVEESGLWLAVVAAETASTGAGQSDIFE